MSVTTIACEQAIFTSLRTPTGEGYRLIAASAALRPDERQAITRTSPSHDAFHPAEAVTTGSGERPYGAAFYPLPTRRLCVAYTCHAGTEHTGRGGQRVYTYNLVFDEAQFPQCDYNPFVVFRAMIAAGLAEPQLKPPSLLPPVELAIADASRGMPRVSLDEAMDATWRAFVLRGLFEDQTLVCHVENEPLAVAEALLLGVPGPLRARVSVGAGIRFSVGRTHRLVLVPDAPATIRSRISGKKLEFVDPRTPCESPAPQTAWTSFVERHWRCSDLCGLAARTSREYPDDSPAARERIGRLLLAMDEVAEANLVELLRLAVERVAVQVQGAEGEFIREWMSKAQRAILARLDQLPWEDARAHLRPICILWRQSDAACEFAQPLLEKVLESAGRQGPMAAAEAALEPAGQIPRAAISRGFGQRLDRILARWAESVEESSRLAIEPTARLCERWAALRSGCPLLARVRRRCQALAAASTA